MQIANILKKKREKNKRAERRGDASCADKRATTLFGNAFSLFSLLLILQYRLAKNAENNPQKRQNENNSLQKTAISEELGSLLLDFDLAVFWIR